MVGVNTRKMEEVVGSHIRLKVSKRIECVFVAKDMTKRTTTTNLFHFVLGGSVRVVMVLNLFGCCHCICVLDT